VPAFDIFDHDAALKASADCPVLELKQAWRRTPEQGLQPGTVRVGWRGNDLLILALLTDASIVTRATEDNQILCELGDAFEIFLGQSGSEGYLEFHVDPAGKRLQLRWPDARAIKEVMEGRTTLDRFLVERPLLGHSSRVVQGGWSVCAAIPGTVFQAPAGRLLGRTWRASFSRYDYSSDKGEPVLSSTSPHAELSFHRQHEWAILEFR
jgi:hypothetical protein